MEEKIFFNGIDLATSTYAFPPMDRARFMAFLEDKSSNDQLPSKDLAAWADPLELSQAGWGIITHNREDPEVLRALKPLIHHRSAQAGKRFYQLVLTDNDLEPSPKGILAPFLERHGAALHGDTDPDQLPYYLLIIGDPRLIPFEFQYELDISFAVGRLHFSDPIDYHSYACNLVAQETRPRVRARRAVLFGALNDTITRQCIDNLSTPLGRKLSSLLPQSSIEVIEGPMATKQKLKALMGGQDTPALLMTQGHGALLTDVGPDPDRRLPFQGGLLCSDWPGHGQQLELSHGFFARDVGPDLDMRGSMAFFFACLSAGTPQYNAFQPDPAQRVQWHPYPFVARLPQKLLAHPKGPLAIIGHVDLAWPYSFLWDQRVHEINHFAAILFSLMQGRPVGLAMEALNHRFATISAQLLARRFSQGPQALDPLHSWIAWHDSRNYIVLGDPATRLSLEGLP